LFDAFRFSKEFTMSSDNGSKPSGFRKATIRHARLRAAFAGPSKSGKSFVSQVIARDLIKTLAEHNNLRGNGRVGVIDSEGGRCEEQYGDLFDFDTFDLFDFSTEAYIDALKIAAEAEFSVVIVDQISHEWAGRNGILERKEVIAKSSGGKKNSFTAWSDATALHNRFIEELVNFPGHLICTMRSRIAHTQDTNAEGKPVVVKLGMEPIQRDTTEYEFDIMGNIDANHILTIESRGSLSLIFDHPFMPGKNVRDAGEVGKIGRIIGEWICDRSKVHESGLIPIEQIEEIKGLGEQLGMTYQLWKQFFSKRKISSLYEMTPELYASVKAKMLSDLAKRENKVEA
jgi:AAA domain